MKKLLTIAIVLSFILVNSVSTPYAIQTESKISAEVCEAIEGIDDDDELSVYVIISDIDYDEVMNKFEESFPEQYNEYYLATECDVASEIRQVVQGGADEKENYIEYDDPIDGNLLQQAIETKRALSAEAYQARNQAFADSLVCKEKQEFVSKYSPMLILTLTKSQILALEDNDDVCRVELLINFKLEEELAVANSISRADYVRDTNGNKGAGVKIGQIDAGVPDITNSDL